MNKGKYSVNDVARYVINYVNSNNDLISNLKLQKVLYFIQAKFLTEVGYPCFKEEIEAWDFGPVIPSVYHEYKQHGAGYIPPVKKFFVYSDDIFECKYKNYSDDIIDDCDKEVINSTIDECTPYSASQLVNLTHNQTPWQNAYSPRRNQIISKKAIKDFFKDDE